MRRIRGIWMVLIVLALIAAACGSDDAETTTTTAAETTTTAGMTAEPLNIAIIAPSAQNDLAFTQSMVDAVRVIVAERGNIDQVDITDGTFNIDDAAAAIRDYASQGYDLVIAHGSQYGGSLQEIAPDFPDVSFAWGTAADTFGLPNVFAYEAASDEGGYAMGVMAAALSTSKVIGIIGPVEVGDAKLYVDAFKLGAEANDSGVTVNVNYTGSFSDVALASEAAQAQVSAGADVLTGSAQMVVGAVTVAADTGVLWFGTQADQASLGNIVVASQVYRWEVVLRDILAKIAEGTMGGEIYSIDLANGGEEIVYNPAYNLDPAVRALGDQTVADIISGSVTTR